MKTNMLLLLALIMLLNSCSVEIEKNSREKWKEEIVETERNFSAMAGEKGIPDAFIYFAAEDAVLMRNNKLVTGREALIAYLEDQPVKVRDEKLSWEPDFVDVSSSGDLGYTYGQFTYSYTDSTGSTVENKGVFHTVWKRQDDGSWRFVWD
jgi:ketosteroid isomerase-like protein